MIHPEPCSICLRRSSTKAPLYSCASRLRAVGSPRIAVYPARRPPSTFFRADSAKDRVFHRGSVRVRVCPCCLADTRTRAATLGRRFQGQRRFGPPVSTVARRTQRVGRRLDSRFTTTVLGVFEILLGNAWFCDGTVVPLIPCRSAIGPCWFARRVR